jgi:hypothetical protein
VWQLRQAEIEQQREQFYRSAKEFHEKNNRPTPRRMIKSEYNIATDSKIAAEIRNIAMELERRKDSLSTDESTHRNLFFTFREEQ